MKAWHVHDGAPEEASLLVIAETRSRAITLAVHAGLWEFDDWIQMRARRAPTWDGLFDEERVVEYNDELPEGAEPFYNDDLC